MDTLTSFEKDAVAALLFGDDPVLVALREQMARAGVTSRQKTGVGFITEIAIPDGASRPDRKPTFKLGDVFGTTDGLEDGFGLLLHVTDGLIDSLEGYAFEDHWPDELQNVTFRYADSSGRDFDKVRQIIHPAG